MLLGLEFLAVGCQCSPCRKSRYLLSICESFIRNVLGQIGNTAEMKSEPNVNPILVFSFGVSSWQCHCNEGVLYPSIGFPKCGGCRELDQFPALLPASVLVLAEGRG